MKLTNTIRDAFIRAVMDDVPSIDYDEQIRRAVVEDALRQAPEFVREAWKLESTRVWVQTATVWHGDVSITIPFMDGYGSDFVLTRVGANLVNPLVEKKTAQRETRDNLRTKIRAVAYSVTTRKALIDALPEFEKYLPADERAALRSVPAVANVVADFVKAGWPKEKAA